MFVNRITIRVKPMRTGKVVEILKEAETIVETPHGSLTYLPYCGQQNVVKQDIKFENLAEIEEFWAEYWSNPDVLALMEGLSELVESDSKDEILRLVE